MNVLFEHGYNVSWVSRVTYAIKEEGTSKRW